MKKHKMRFADRVTWPEIVVLFLISMLALCIGLHGVSHGKVTTADKCRTYSWHYAPGAAEYRIYGREIGAEEWELILSIKNEFVTGISCRAIGADQAYGKGMEYYIEVRDHLDHIIRTNKDNPDQIRLRRPKKEEPKAMASDRRVL
jgi:hypothetical protein